MKVRRQVKPAKAGALPLELQAESGGAKESRESANESKADEKSLTRRRMRAAKLPSSVWEGKIKLGLDWQVIVSHLSNSGKNPSDEDMADTIYKLQQRSNT